MTLPLDVWAANIPNTSVAACLTSTATLPSAISTSEALYNLVVGFRDAQDQYNNESVTAPPYLNTVSPIIYDSNLQADVAEGNDYRTVQASMTFRQYINETGIKGQEGLTII